MAKCKEPRDMSPADWEQLSLTSGAFRWAISNYIGSALPDAYSISSESPSAVVSMAEEPLVTSFIVEGHSGSYQVLFRSLADIPPGKLKGEDSA